MAMYNKIDFHPWGRDDTFDIDGVEISVNESSTRPIVMKCEGQENMGNWMTPDEARELAAKLIEAADAADRAGLLENAS